MGKFNLSEAAKEILGASVASKKAGQDKPSRLHGDVAYGTKEVGDIGTEVLKTTDSAPDATRGVPTATAPGATPPVGSEAKKTLSAQPGQKGSYEEPEGKAKANSRFGKPNPKATFQSYGEDKEASEEEVISEDEIQDESLVERMLAKDKLKEDMDALLSGENLSEEFVTKASTIFEAAVIARSEEVIASVEAELTEQFETAVEEIKEELAAKVDDYLNYMVEEWMKDNELAIEKGLRAEIVEDFIGGLRDLFVEHYIDIPAEQVNVVEELSAKVEELESALNEQINRGVELTKDLNESKKIEAIYTACEGLTQTQVEKLKALAEGVEFNTEEEFVTKLDVLKESYFKADVKVAEASALDEILVEEEKKAVKSSDPSMDIYAKTISATLK